MQSNTEDVTFHADGTMLLRAMLAVGVGAATDDSRPILQSLLIEQTAGTITVVATDSYRLVKAAADMSVEHGDVDPFSILVGYPKGSEATLKKLLVKVNKYRNDARILKVTSADKMLMLETHDPADRVILPLIEGDFPNYGNLIPDPSTWEIGGTHVAFNPGYLADIAKCHKLSGADKQKPVVLRHTPDHLKPALWVWEGIDDEPSVMYLLMPVRVADNDGVLISGSWQWIKRDV